MTHLVVILKEGVVFESWECRDPKHQEGFFRYQCDQHGLCPLLVDYDAGYVELPDGTTMCIIESNTVEDFDPLVDLIELKFQNNG